MTTEETAHRLIQLIRENEIHKAYSELYDENIVSYEPRWSEHHETKGIQGVIAKAEHFNGMVEEYHGTEVSEPIVVGKYFTCYLGMDCKLKGQERNKMEEVCVYKVENGKIVEESFFF